MLWVIQTSQVDTCHEFVLWCLSDVSEQQDEDLQAPSRGILEVFVRGINHYKNNFNDKKISFYYFINYNNYNIIILNQ